MKFFDNVAAAAGRLTFRDLLAMFLINAFVVALFYLLGRQFPKQNEQLIVYMLGQLSGFTGTAVALYFTASKQDEQTADDRTKIADAVKDVAAVARAASEGPTGTAADPINTKDVDQ